MTWLDEMLFAPGPCGLCKRSPAVGFASVNGVWFCHGDLDETPTCYMRAQSLLSGMESLAGGASRDECETCDDCCTGNGCECAEMFAQRAHPPKEERIP